MSLDGAMRLQISLEAKLVLGNGYHYMLVYGSGWPICHEMEL